MNFNFLLFILVLVFGSASGFAESIENTELQKLCQELTQKLGRYSWNIQPCEGIEWKTLGKSVEGRPLVYAEFGNPNTLNTTLVLGMVHGDELTPLYLSIELAHWLKEHEDTFKNIHVILAPLVNPDSFLKEKPTRTNSRGVDVNRNFPTRDWNKNALKFWKTKFLSNQRRFPGNKAGSEPETVFQQDLIKKFSPSKILSMHAPLNYFDYDGPTRLSLSKFPKKYVQECIELKRNLNAIHGGFYPGSLGNYAGHEMGIPTITLELPTANVKKAETYWRQFKPGIKTMIEFEVPKLVGQNLVAPTKK